MANEIKNLRIHFYGVQGSGSVFPRVEERNEIRRQSETVVLEKALSLVQAQLTSGTRHNDVVEAVLGGPITDANLNKLWSSMAVAEPPSYGGWTSCFRVETSDGHDIVFDCGSGFRLCAQDLESKWAQRESRSLTIFGSHAHFDHTEGFDQADVCFNPKNHIHVYGNASYLHALDQSLGIFSHQVDASREGRQTPLTYKLMPAHFEATELRDLSPESNSNPAASTIAHHLHDWRAPIKIGNTRIQAIEVFHPDPCLAYRLEHNGKVFIYCTDHELRHGPNSQHPLQLASMEAEQRLKQHSNNADVMYRDGQFLRAEYDGTKGIGSGAGVARRDWGHSCIEDIVAMAKECNIKRTFIGHHDPSRPWLERTEIDAMLQRSAQPGAAVELAKAETVIDL